MKIPHKTLERKLFRSGYQLVYAVDEVGMGCLAGPVVVCVVGFTNHFYNKINKKFFRLRDSKLLLPGQREKFAEKLMEDKDLVYALTYARPKTIDKLNVYGAARKEMKRAVLALQPVQDHQNSRAIVLIDGKTKIKGLDMEQVSVVKGDRKVFAIACASIIAKVYRDKMMVRYSKKYPGYGFERHKGYGTKFHRAQLISLGLCKIHRKSFAPVLKLL